MCILCRSAERQEKERAIHARAAERLEAELQKLAASGARRRTTPQAVYERVGRLGERYARASRLFRIDVTPTEDGRTQVTWERQTAWQDWSELADGCRLLRMHPPESLPLTPW